MSQPQDMLPSSSAPMYAPQAYPMGSMGGNFGSMYRPSFMSSGFATPSYMTQPQPQYEGKGKQKAEESRFVELADDKAWDAAFASNTTPTVQELKEQEPILDPEAEDDPLTANLDAEWRRMQSDLNNYSAMDKEMAEWEAQYGSQFVNQDGDYSLHTADTFDFEELVQNPPVYEFQQEENMFKDHPDPFEEGKRLLAAGAPFIEVEQAFEEACQRDSSRAEAWTALGETLAADEKEILAIKALERAISLPSPAGAESAWLVSLLCAFVR
jgi:peroxin-5